jgi:hypothetical protein
MESLEKAFLILIFMIGLVSCNQNSYQTVEAEVFYKRDMILEVNGVKGEGVVVAPLSSSIPFYVVARGDLDLFTFTSCHREETAENAGNVTESQGSWIFKRTITKKREVKLTFSPTEIENVGGCPILLGGYEQEKGRHSWGFVDFETPDAALPASVSCNGVTTKSKGVSICQARAGLIQSIRFASQVKVSPDAGCEIGATESDYFEFSIPKGQCVFAFMESTGRIHRLTTLGYEQILIRK